MTNPWVAVCGFPVSVCTQLTSFGSGGPEGWTDNPEPSLGPQGVGAEVPSGWRTRLCSGPRIVFNASSAPTELPEVVSSRDSSSDPKLPSLEPAPHPETQATASMPSVP